MLKTWTSEFLIYASASGTLELSNIARYWSAMDVDIDPRFGQCSQQ